MKNKVINTMLYLLLKALLIKLLNEKSYSEDSMI